MKASVLLTALLPLVCTSSDPYSTASTARRERNLDHLDIGTLTYYLGVDIDSYTILKDRTYVGYDVAVMFYAQWDENSRRFAPYWDSIATYAKAGTKEANLILGLFNCELDAAHRKLCKAIGVTSYPTMMFIGAGTYPDQALVGKSKDSTPLPHTVKFLGNWQYGDAVLDWVHAMQGISSWHQWGLIKNIRKGLLGIFIKQTKKGGDSLPVGLPLRAGGNSNGEAAATAAQLSILEKKLQLKGNESDSYKQMATHASLLLDYVLFPPTKADPFVVLSETKGWNNTDDPVAVVVRACALELSLDYCSRLSSHVTNDWLDNVYNASEQYSNFTVIDQELKNTIKAKEPFCAIFEACLDNDFESEKCQPSKCPFQAEVACRYMTSCFDTSIQSEYAVALKLIAKGESFPPKKKPTDDSAKKASGTKGTGSGGWFA